MRDGTAGLYWRAMPSVRALLLGTCLPLLAGCVARVPPPKLPPPRAALPRIGFSIQVGAFANADNAISLCESLGRLGVEAVHFVDHDGLNKVRFGSFPDKEAAVARAGALQQKGIFGAYYVVPPAQYGGLRGDAELRARVVRSAGNFLGRPYRWGGPSPETGFDCSGLTLTAYRLNGLALPRTAAEQYAAGEPVSSDRLREADLVFFATESRNKPTHVGLYVGQGRFIHAPGRGKVVRVDELSASYYRQRFLGARSYFQ